MMNPLVSARLMTTDMASLPATVTSEEAVGLCLQENEPVLLSML